MNSRIKKVSAAALLLATTLTTTAFADDAPAPEAPKAEPGTFAAIMEKSGVTATGFVAASYYHSNGYNTSHQFDTQHDTFQLDEAGIQIGYQPKEGFGGFVDLRAGEDMKILHAAEDGNSNTFDAVQAYLQYATGPLTVIAGKYVTLAGAEVIAPTGNTNYSRSLLFFGEPLTHTGVRATYALNDTINLYAGVNNGWNRTSTSYGSKTGEVGAAWTPNKIFSLAAYAYIGKDASFDANRTFIDLVGTYNVTESLSVVVSYDYGKQKQHFEGESDLRWSAIAGYLNYAITDQYRVSLRGELLDDKGGFVTGAPQKAKEVTLTFGYAPVKAFELRAELRRDWSNEATFVHTVTSDEDVNPVSKNQTEVAIQGVFKF
jgi:Putative beta-barrel porin-2, OmpL-like. bbp2